MSIGLVDCLRIPNFKIIPINCGRQERVLLGVFVTFLFWISRGYIAPADDDFFAPPRCIFVGGTTASKNLDRKYHQDYVMT